MVRKRKPRRGRLAAQVLAQDVLEGTIVAGSLREPDAGLLYSRGLSEGPCACIAGLT